MKKIILVLSFLLCFSVFSFASYFDPDYQLSFQFKEVQAPDMFGGYNVVYSYVGDWENVASIYNTINHDGQIANGWLVNYDEVSHEVTFNYQLWEFPWLADVNIDTNSLNMEYSGFYIDPDTWDFYFSDVYSESIVMGNYLFNAWGGNYPVPVNDIWSAVQIGGIANNLLLILLGFVGIGLMFLAYKKIRQIFETIGNIREWNKMIDRRNKNMGSSGWKYNKWKMP